MVIIVVILFKVTVLIKLDTDVTMELLLCVTISYTWVRFANIIIAAIPTVATLIVHIL